ncbi:protein NLRC5-like, partial [Sinocyclocheilus grahami]|uniref:protein NLRC5-like n=1 Tax=Sinocyclocheilus grahami TaxID=75366 RepID=UPI0007ACEE0B
FAVPHDKTAGSWNKRKRLFILDLCLQAALHQKETIEETVKKLLSSVNYKKCDFLLDLCSHVKDYETQTGRSVLPALQPIYQSAPAVWRIKLSERKSSILLEVLKLQTEKKPVELRDWTDEESEVKGFLQCLPYISQLRLSKEALQQLVSVVYEAQDDELTRCFLKKVSEDLTSCSLTWEVIHYLLQHQALNLKLDFRKSKTSCENIRELLPVLDRIQLKRLSPSFTLSIIMEIYETRFPQYVSSLMSSAGNDINLNARVLDSVHCAALRFTLEHCNTVKLNLLWTSIPEEQLESFLPLLSRVKQLSVDRLLLLKLLHCCSSSDLQQEAADVLLAALHNTLDFSCCSALDLTDTQENQEHLKLTEKDCRIISSVLQKTQSIVKLILQDCELSDTALKQLWPILPQVQLNCSKALLLQFLACISKDGSQRGSLRSAEALSQALGGEMDLSHTQMDPRVCEQLALFLEYSEGLTELDLSHCKLTDLCMEPLLPHLHKTQTLDLSHNNITDESAKRVHSVVCTHSNIQTVRLFRNKISDRKQFIGDKRFEIW